MHHAAIIVGLIENNLNQGAVQLGQTKTDALSIIETSSLGWGQVLDIEIGDIAA